MLIGDGGGGWGGGGATAVMRAGLSMVGLVCRISYVAFLRGVSGRISQVWCVAFHVSHFICRISHGGKDQKASHGAMTMPCYQMAGCPSDWLESRFVHSWHRGDERTTAKSPFACKQRPAATATPIFIPY